MPAIDAMDLANYAAQFGVKRQRIGSMTTTMTRQNKNLPVLVEAGEYTKKSRRSGRYKRRTLKHLYNIVSTNQQPQWYRFSGKNRFNANGGFYGLPNHLNTSAPATEYLPVYFFELQTCVNFNGSVQNPTPFWQAYRNNTGNSQYILVAQNGPNGYWCSFCTMDC